MLQSFAPAAFSPPPLHFTEEEHGSWAAIGALHRERRGAQMVPMFLRGLHVLGLDTQRIPSLDEVNTKLNFLTGWRGVYAKGLEKGPAFFKMLRDRKYPIAQFVRAPSELGHTPNSDVVHGLYGHLPFLANEEYADYCQRFGELACQFLDDSTRLRQLERYFWFTTEMGLVQTSEGLRILGAGIASSVSECTWALSGKPEVLPFDVEQICEQEFRTDQLQPRLFLLDAVEQLYMEFPKLEAFIRG